MSFMSNYNLYGTLLNDPSRGSYHRPDATLAMNASSPSTSSALSSPPSPPSISIPSLSSLPPIATSLQSIPLNSPESKSSRSTLVQRTVTKGPKPQNPFFCLRNLLYKVMRKTHANLLPFEMQKRSKSGKHIKSTSSFEDDEVDPMIMTFLEDLVFRLVAADGSLVEPFCSKNGSRVTSILNPGSGKLHQNKMSDIAAHIWHKWITGDLRRKFDEMAQRKKRQNEILHSTGAIIATSPTKRYRSSANESVLFTSPRRPKASHSRTPYNIPNAKHITSRDRFVINGTIEENRLSPPVPVPDAFNSAWPSPVPSMPSMSFTGSSISSPSSTYSPVPSLTEEESSYLSQSLPASSNTVVPAFSSLHTPVSIPSPPLSSPDRHEENQVQPTALTQEFDALQGSVDDLFSSMDFTNLDGSNIDSSVFASLKLTDFPEIFPNVYPYTNDSNSFSYSLSGAGVGTVPAQPIANNSPSSGSGTGFDYTNGTQNDYSTSVSYPSPSDVPSLPILPDYGSWNTVLLQSPPREDCPGDEFLRSAMYM